MKRKRDNTRGFNEPLHNNHRLVCLLCSCNRWVCSFTVSMNKFKIGDVVENTDAFETVKVLDVFKSETTGQWCYHVGAVKGDVSFLCWEGELNSGQWIVK